MRRSSLRFPGRRSVIGTAMVRSPSGEADDLRSPWRGPRLALLGAAAAVSGCTDGRQSFLTPDGPVAAAQYRHLVQVVLIVLIVVIPVIVGVPLIAWRYRAGNTRARYAPEWNFSAALEWPMWLVPVAVVAALSVLLWKNAHRLDPYRPIAAARTPLRVDVVGLDPGAGARRVRGCGDARRRHLLQRCRIGSVREHRAALPRRQRPGAHRAAGLGRLWRRPRRGGRTVRVKPTPYRVIFGRLDPGALDFLRPSWPFSRGRDRITGSGR